MPKTILIVDDDPHICEVIAVKLQSAGFAIESASDGAAGLTAVKTVKPDLIILDVGMPQMDGIETCRELRKTSETPVLFLTARDDEIDRIIGFEVGGDDYVTKPFSPRELVARVKAILKRVQPINSDDTAPKKWGELFLDETRHQCLFHGAPINLTRSELSLLSHLMKQPESVLSRAQLENAVYGQNIHVSERTIDSHIRNLRKKLSDAGCKNGIVTIHGVGMRMGDCT